MTVQSSIPIDAVYLDGRVSYVLINSVGSLEDNTGVVATDNGLVDVHERWDRAKQHWNLSWHSSTNVVERLFKVNRQSRGFLWISPRDNERVATGQLLRNTVTGLNTGDGSTTTFQLQVIDSTTAHSVTRDVNYPLNGSQTDISGATFTSTYTAYKNGVSATSSINLTTGVVTFATAPLNAVVPTADFSFAWPVMFGSSTISTTWLQVKEIEARSVAIDEVF